MTASSFLNCGCSQTVCQFTHKTLAGGSCPEHATWEEALAAALPSSVDLRESMPPIMDQGDLGSSTACAFTAMIEGTPPGPTGVQATTGYFGATGPGDIFEVAGYNFVGRVNVNTVEMIVPDDTRITVSDEVHPGRAKRITIQFASGKKTQDLLELFEKLGAHRIPK